MSEYRLKIYRTDEYLQVDPVDWETVRHIRWVIGDDGQVQCEMGQSYWSIVGIDVDVKNKFGRRFDMRRRFLVPAEENWRFCEYAGGFIRVTSP